MPCDPYKSTRRLRARRPSAMRGIADRWSLVLAMLAGLACPGGAGAQWWSAPMESPVCNACPPIIVCPPRQVIVRRPIAQGEPALVGPRLPSSAPPGPQPVITNFYPADGLSPAPPDTSVALDGIPGELRVVLTEALLNRLLARADTNAGPVQDFVLGANVSGEQTTESRVSVDVQPSPNTARLFLQLAGTTVNQTIGVTLQAAVRSRGLHDFRLTKQVDFDGRQFTTRSPAAWVTPRLANEGAVTPMSGMPLIGPLATQIALSEAERRRPAAEQVVSQRVTEQVAPRFNGEVDQQLGRANDQLRSVIPRWLTAAGLTPEDQLLASTDDQVWFGLALPSSGIHQAVHRPTRLRLSATPVSLPTSDTNTGWVPIRQVTQRVSRQARPFLPSPRVAAGRSLTIAIHEQFVNHLLQRVPLEGMQVSDRTIDRMLALLGDVLTGTPISQALTGGSADDDPEFATILLADDQPLTVRFESGQAIVVAHAGFRPLVAPEVPMQHIEIPFTLSTNEGQHTLVPGEVNVEALGGEGFDAMGELAGPVIQQQVSSRLSPVTLPGSAPLRLPGLPQLSLTIRDVVLADGWLVIVVD